MRGKVMALGLGLTLAGCATLEDRTGYMPPSEDVDAVVVGLDTRDTVSVILGEPGTSGVIADTGWYYVSSEYERFLWRAPVEVDREVLAVSFADDGVVTNIERFGLQDGRVVALSRRVTERNTQGVGLLRQIFSNIGGFSADQFLGDQ